MYVTGWIHAKSKFLGLSLGVHQIGLGQYMYIYSYNPSSWVYPSECISLGVHQIGLGQDSYIDSI